MCGFLFLENKGLRSYCGGSQLPNANLEAFRTTPLPANESLKRSRGQHHSILNLRRTYLTGAGYFLCIYLHDSIFLFFFLYYLFFWQALVMRLSTLICKQKL